MKIYICFFIILSSFSLNAQSLLPIKYGIKIGASMSNFLSEPNNSVENIKSSPEISYAAGLVIAIPINEKWEIIPEFIYTQKSASFTYNYTHNYNINSRDQYLSDNTISITYVEFNPIISYKTNDKIALNFGPSLSFLIQEDFTFKEKLTSEILASSSLELLQSPEFTSESIDIGLNLGASYSLFDNIKIDTKFNFGLVSAGEIIKEIYTGSFGNPQKFNIFNLKNSSTVLSILYLF